MLHFKVLFLLNTLQGSPKQLSKPLHIPTVTLAVCPSLIVLPFSPKKAILLPLQICVSPYLQFFGFRDHEPKDAQLRL